MGAQPVPIAYVAIGGNLPDGRGRSSIVLLGAVLDSMSEQGLRLRKRSRWYRSPAWPPSDQPDYTNGVVSIENPPDAHRLMTLLHGLERDFGRDRDGAGGVRNAARTVDLDLIDWQGRVLAAGDADQRLILPHPRAHERAFVLKPLADVVEPGWCHPVSGLSVGALLGALPDQGASAQPIE